MWQAPNMMRIGNFTYTTQTTLVGRQLDVSDGPITFGGSL
jgi:hypothetical protein